DSDCIPDKCWLENGVRNFEKGIQRVAGKIEVFCKDPERKTMAELHEMMFAFNQQRNVDKLKSSVTANLFVCKSLFMRAGLFDSTKKSGEDLEWNKRVSAVGVGIVFDEYVIVKHPARESINDLARKARRVLGGKKFTIASIKEAYQILSYLPRMFIYNLLPAIFRALTSDKK